VLVTPAPSTRHQHVAFNMARILDDYVRQNHLGVIFWDVDLLFSTGEFLRPDLLYVARRDLDGVTSRGVETRPDLVVEVVSPSSAGIDRVKKARRYAELAVPEYWVVDPDTESIEVYRAAGATERWTEQLVWQPDPALAPLEAPLARVFESFRDRGGGGS
jgi:Uma2 family endonuclease